MSTKTNFFASAVSTGFLMTAHVVSGQDAPSTVATSEKPAAPIATLWFEANSDESISRKIEYYVHAKQGNEESLVGSYTVYCDMPKPLSTVYGTTTEGQRISLNFRDGSDALSTLLGKDTPGFLTPVDELLKNPDFRPAKVCDGEFVDVPAALANLKFAFRGLAENLANVTPTQTPNSPDRSVNSPAVFALKN